MKKFLMLMLVSSFLSLSAFAAEGKVDPNCTDVLQALATAQKGRAEKVEEATKPGEDPNSTSVE